MSSVTIVTPFSVLFTIFPSPSSTSTSGIILCEEFGGCGMGKCMPSDQTAVKFECECDPGWKKAVFSSDTFLKRYPCIIPDCPLKHSCSEAVVRAESGMAFTNFSHLEPCYWAKCERGIRDMFPNLTYACQSWENSVGTYSDVPCLKECSFGGECLKRLTPPIHTIDANNGSHQAQLLLHEAWLNGIIVLAISMAIMAPYAQYILKSNSGS